MLGKFLDKVKAIITGARNETYGDPQESFAKIAAIFRLLTGISIRPEHVAIFFVVVKLVREGYESKPDNTIDAAGYLAIYDYIKNGEDDDVRYEIGTTD